MASSAAAPPPFSDPSVLVDYASNYPGNILSDFFKAFQVYKRNLPEVGPVHFSVEYFPSSSSFSPEIFSHILSLTRTNMFSYYEKCRAWGGWSEKKKIEEFANEKARFLMVFKEEENKEAEKNEKSSGISSDSLSKPRLPIAFVHFRFEVECSYPVCYLYEIQLDSAYQRRGLGKYLCQLIELIAWRFHMDKVVLTVFQYNQPAVNLYRKQLNYEIDEDDPNEEEEEKQEKQQRGKGGKQNNGKPADDSGNPTESKIDYWILSKKNKKLQQQKIQLALKALGQ